MVEKKTDKSIKCLRPNNGGKFSSIEFEQYCKDEGIVRHEIFVYTSQQNGVVEHMNQTLMERDRSMINNANLQKELWAEAVSTACYLVNRSPSVAINCTIVEEDPSSKKIIISRDVTFDESSLLNSDVVKVEQEQVSLNQKIQLEAKPFPESQKEGETYEERGEEDAKKNLEIQEIVQQPITLRRSTRERRTPKRYEDFSSSIALIIEDGEPSCYEEAVDDKDSKKWKKDMEEEMDSLAKNKT
eukprot:PITA_08372